MGVEGVGGVFDSRGMKEEPLRPEDSDYAPHARGALVGPYALSVPWLIAVNIILAGIYFAAGKFGLLLAMENPSASAVWPPTGIAIAAVLIFSYRVWPALVVGAFLVNVTTPGSSAGVSGAIAIGNTLEALAGGIMVLKWAGGRSAFLRAQTVLKFALFAAVAATMISATIGVTALCVGKSAAWESYHRIWTTWWLGDLGGALLLAPLLVTWSNPPAPRWTLERAIETACVAALVTVLNVWVFVREFGVGFSGYPVEYFAILPMLWAAFRLGPRGATGTAVLTAVVAVYGTAQGLGPFATPELSVNTSLVLLQAFLATITLAALLLASVMKDRQRVSDELARSERELSEFFENAPIGLRWATIDGRILRVNRTELEMFGYASREYLGRNVEEFAVDVQQMRLMLARLTRGETLHNCEAKVRCADGTISDVLISANVYMENGRFVHTRFFTRDITPRKKAEQAMQAAKEQAEAASLAKDRFLAVLSHELRTPLTPVLICAQELVTRTDLPADLREVVEMVRRNVELEARLIDDLLDLTRIARGRLMLELRTVDLHESIRNAVDMCRSDISQRQLNLDLKLGASRHHARVDGARLQEVFWNLIKNAVKFTPTSGRITVSSCDAIDASKIRIDVSDTGIGIEPDVLPRIFNAFEQGEQSVAQRFGGLGLGLAITKALVEMHHGTIVARSAGKDTGATFTIHLPTTAAPVKNPDASPASLPAPEKKLDILLVDDHEDTSRTMQRLLERVGHRVSTAGTMNSALHAAGGRKFDLVISDIGLPDGSGLELMRQLGRDVNLKGIALSGFGMDEDVQRSREAGFAEHLTKPVDFQKLCSVIDQITAHQHVSR